MILAAFAFLTLAMLAVLAIVVLVPRLARPGLLPAYRAAAITITAAAYAVALAAYWGAS